MARAATKTVAKKTNAAAKQAPAPAAKSAPVQSNGRGEVKTSVTPYQMITVAGKAKAPPERVRRTEFGWESMTKPKHALVIPWEKEPSARSSISAYAKTHRNKDGSGPAFTVYAYTDENGQIEPRLTANGEVIKDKRGNPKPNRYVVERTNDYPVGYNHND